MTDLTVERLHARAAVADPDDAARVRGLLADLAARRLDEAMSAVPLPPGDWYVRRLEVPLLLDPARADAAIARDWARTVADALGTALGRAGPDVVRFRGRLDATADLVAALSLGRPDREWAWRAAGVIADGDPGPASRPPGRRWPPWPVTRPAPSMPSAWRWPGRACRPSTGCLARPAGARSPTSCWPPRGSARRTGWATPTPTHRTAPQSGAAGRWRAPSRPGRRSPRHGAGAACGQVPRCSGPGRCSPRPRQNQPCCAVPTRPPCWHCCPPSSTAPVPAPPSVRPPPRVPRSRPLATAPAVTGTAAARHRGTERTSHHRRSMAGPKRDRAMPEPRTP